jgi:hypothetical protein
MNGKQKLKWCCSVCNSANFLSKKEADYCCGGTPWEVGMHNFIKVALREHHCLTSDKEFVPKVKHRNYKSCKLCLAAKQWEDSDKTTPGFPYDIQRNP